MDAIAAHSLRRRVLSVWGLGTLLVLASLLVRVLLVAEAPGFRGYYFDDCWPPIKLIVDSGRLPDHDACWQCYQPPGFLLASAGVVGAARALGVSVAASRWLPMILNSFLAAALAVFAALLVARVGRLTDPGPAAACVAIWTTPVLALSGAGLNLDVAVNLLMLASVWLVVRLHGRRGSLGSWGAAGILAGAAACCKYTGLIGPFVLLGLLAAAVIWRSDPGWDRKGLATALLLALLVAAPVYGRNLLASGRLMPGNRGNAESFSLSGAGGDGLLDLVRLPVGALLASPFDDPEDPALQLQVYYRAPMTAFYGLMVTDLEFFSVPGVSPFYRFPPRSVPPTVSLASLLAGLPMLVLAAAGGVLSLRLRHLLPVHLLLVTHLALAMLYRALGGPWFTKAIYNLSIIGPTAVYVAVALACVARRSRIAGTVSTALVLVCATVWLTWTAAFALG